LIAKLFRIKFDAVLDISDTENLNASLRYIVEDDYVKGNYLLVIGYAVCTTSNFVKIYLIAGDLQISGYAEGIKNRARFGYINGIITDPFRDTHIWISDQDNGCFRIINRKTNATAELTGKCTSRYVRNARIEDAGIAYPLGITRKPYNLGITGITYFYESQKQTVRSIWKIESYWYVNTLYQLGEPINSMIFDPTGVYLYFTTNSSIMRVSSTWKHQPETVISGFGHNDGGLRSANVRDPKHLLFLEDRTFLFADYSNHVIRVVELNSLVTTICVPQLDDVQVSEGIYDTCLIKNPRQFVRSKKDPRKIYFIGDSFVFELKYSGELASRFQ